MKEQMKSLQPDPGEIRRSIGALYQADDVIEVRIPKTHQGTISGYFDDHAKLVQTLAGLNGNYIGIYITLNPCHPALLARSANRLKVHANFTTSDHDILLRRWLPIDCDPLRPAGVSSTDAEHEAALEKTCEIREVLAEEGWPAPIRGDSGNGSHLLYRIDLPNDEASERLLKRVLKGLAARFDDEIVKIDQTLYNAARIIKCYGTPTHKGDDIAERPHRLSRVLESPWSM